MLLGTFSAGTAPSRSCRLSPNKLFRHANLPQGAATLLLQRYLSFLFVLQLPNQAYTRDPGVPPALSLHVQRTTRDFVFHNSLNYDKAFQSAYASPESACPCMHVSRSRMPTLKSPRPRVTPLKDNVQCRCCGGRNRCHSRRVGTCGSSLRQKMRNRRSLACPDTQRPRRRPRVHEDGPTSSPCRVSSAGCKTCASSSGVVHLRTPRAWVEAIPEVATCWPNSVFLESLQAYV